MKILVLDRSGNVAKSINIQDLDLNKSLAQAWLVQEVQQAIISIKRQDELDYQAAEAWAKAKAKFESESEQK